MYDGLPVETLKSLSRRRYMCESFIYRFNVKYVQATRSLHSCLYACVFFLVYIQQTAQELRDGAQGEEEKALGMVLFMPEALLVVPEGSQHVVRWFTNVTEDNDGQPVTVTRVEAQVEDKVSEYCS